MNILEMHSCDSRGITTHDLDWVHSGPGEMAGIRTESEDRVWDALQNRIDFVFHFDRASDVRVQHGPHSFSDNGG